MPDWRLLPAARQLPMGTALQRQTWGRFLHTLCCCALDQAGGLCPCSLPACQAALLSPCAVLQDAAGVRMRGLLDRVEALLSSDSDPQVGSQALPA